MTTFIGKYGMWSTFNLTNLVRGLIRNSIERSLNPRALHSYVHTSDMYTFILQCRNILENGVYLILHKAFFNKGSH